jgi:probable F420-dependent oxidoreductase
MKVRIAIAPGGGFDAASYIGLIDGLERLGFDTVWLSDVPLAPTIDPIVGLGVAAGRTRRLKLGANVVPLGRNPLLLAKELTQLDHLSGGRVLLSLVPGLDQPGERETLGFNGNRGAYLDAVIDVLRRLWSGEQVDERNEWFTIPGLRLASTPLQTPLEIWLGGQGPAALARAGRLSDGWLGATVTPSEAAVAVGRINEAAAAVGRTIDHEHFGLSLAYSRTPLADSTVAALRARRPDGDLTDIVPVGGGAIVDLLGRLTEVGLSKFVLRPLNTQPIDWDDELGWLAEHVLPLQT